MLTPKTLFVTAPALLLVATTMTTTTTALDTKLSGLNYDLRQGADWANPKCKTTAQVQSDLKTLSTVTSNVRTYSLTDCPIRPVIAAAKALKLTVWLGLWVSSDDTVFTAELAELGKLIEEGLIDDSIVGINVGSEAIYRGDVDATTVRDELFVLDDAPLGISRTCTGIFFSGDRQLEESQGTYHGKEPVDSRVDHRHCRHAHRVHRHHRCGMCDAFYRPK